MYTLAQMRAFLSARIPLTSDTTLVQGWQDQAIGECIDTCWWRIQRVAFLDFTLNGVTQRFTIPGEDVILLPPARQVAPDGVTGTTQYLPYASVSWRQRAPDAVTTEPNVDVAGLPTVTPSVTVAATTPPAPILNVATTKLRLWYQCRVPQPDYTVPTSPIYVPEQFARIATLCYYTGIISDNQAGGDMRQWRKQSEEYRQQAGLLYAQSVPLAFPQEMQADDYLLTGRV
jgi:hypothetical protein